MSLAKGGELSNQHLTIVAEQWKPFWIIYCPNGIEKWNYEWDPKTQSVDPMTPCPGTSLISYQMFVEDKPIKFCLGEQTFDRLSIFHEKIN